MELNIRQCRERAPRDSLPEAEALASEAPGPAEIRDAEADCHTVEPRLSFVFDECAVNKWYDAQGLRELEPYCNFADVTDSRLMGMGVDARETTGLGCQQCALRFKHGRETVVPQALEGIVADR